MGNLVMPKQSAVASEMKAVLQVYFEHDDWLSNEIFITSLKAIIGDELEPQAYTKKTQIPAYFGFITWEDISKPNSRRKITESGKRFYQGLLDEDNDVIFRELISSLEENTFGRNVCGVSSDSDVEPPQIFIRSALMLEYLTRKEFGYILWCLDDFDDNLFEVLSRVSKNRHIEDFSYNEHPTKFNDAKPITALINWGILKEENRQIKVNSDLFQDYLSTLYSLKTNNNDIQGVLPAMDEDNDDKASNIIFFGSPGTGKSYSADETTYGYIVEKTTFHPEYDYNSFVGGYKPIMNEEGEESKIEYKFVPQIFTNVYINAWKDLESHHFLQIEEINRGNCAEIFGDLFQLLDRDNEGKSKYEISASEELKTHLIKEFGDVEHEGIRGNKLRLPSNLSIVATMNTSDQSLFPMDSAFKRRWNWEYVPIKYNCEDSDFTIKLDNDNEYNWLDFLKEVNQRIYKATQSQDKQIGNWFINAQNTENIINEKTFINKVVFYLWNDVFKDEDETIFIKEEELLTYEHFFAENKTDLLEYIFTTNLNLEPITETTTDEEEVVEES